jgi:hypothetical protein
VILAFNLKVLLTALLLLFAPLPPKGAVVPANISQAMESMHEL